MVAVVNAVVTGAHLPKALQPPAGGFNADKSRIAGFTGNQQIAIQRVPRKQAAALFVQQHHGARGVSGTGVSRHHAPAQVEFLAVFHGNAFHRRVPFHNVRLRPGIIPVRVQLGKNGGVASPACNVGLRVEDGEIGFIHEIFTKLPRAAGVVPMAVGHNHRKGLGG